MLGSRGNWSVGVTIKLVGTFIYPIGRTIKPVDRAIYAVGTFIYPVGRVVYAVGTTINSPRNIMAAAVSATSPVIGALSTLPERVAVVAETTPAAWDRCRGALGE